MWGRFIVFGQAMERLLGIILIVQICRTIVSQILACFDIYKKEKKFNWKMTAGLLPFVAKTLMLHGHSKDIAKLKKIYRAFKNLPPITDEQFIWYLRQKLNEMNETPTQMIPMFPPTNMHTEQTFNNSNRDHHQLVEEW